MNVQLQRFCLSVARHELENVIDNPLKTKRNVALPEVTKLYGLPVLRVIELVDDLLADMDHCL